ncbi:MAG: hypothetical protein JXQ68_03330, partial [Campylobacterales bacterium]|nr:hypothetical protein [Campylobacterales bacterium]
MKFSMKISLALLLLILLFTFCIYIHTQSIHEDMNQRKNIIAAENATQESVKIAIDKKDKDIYFSASLDSQDAYDMLDDRLTDATHSITRVVKINENLKNSDKVISLVSKLIDILKKYYEYGSITYKDGMLVFDGITHDEEAKSKIDLILSASLIPSVDRSSYEKKFVEMSYPKLSEEAQVLEVRMNEIAEVEDIIFEESSAKLTIKSLDTINKIAQILKENNTYTIEIS